MATHDQETQQQASHGIYLAMQQGFEMHQSQMLKTRGSQQALRFVR